MDDQRFQFGLLGMTGYMEIFSELQKPPEHICKYFSAGTFPERAFIAFTRNLTGVSNLTMLGDRHT